MSEPSMPPIDADYVSARARFLAAADRLDLTPTTHEHPLKGRQGEALGTDVVVLGDADARRVVLLISGTHGVEGYAGSALQSAWLESGPEIPTGVRVVVLHGINPHGFSFDRRVNEDNVDLNRNFIPWDQPTPASDDYDSMADIAVPAEWTPEAQEESTAALLALVAERGIEWVQATLSGGQYNHPGGLFYGGDGPTWSHRTLREIVSGCAVDADRLTIIDLHTGLGPWGHGELIASAPSTDPTFQRAAALWGDVTSIADGTSVSAEIAGEWISSVDQWLPNVEVTAAALEYGTLDPISVMQSLRADAWRFGAGQVDPETIEEIRRGLRAAFLDESQEWATVLWLRFVEVLDSALAA